MKTVFLVPPLDRRFWSKDYYPALGSLYIASALENAGFETDIIDLNIEHRDPEAAAGEILSRDPGLIAITTTTLSRFFVRELVGILDRISSIPIVVGGTHFTYTAADALEKIPGIDLVVLGEGEETIIETAKRIEGGGDLEGIPGTAYRAFSGRPVMAPPRPLIEDLNSIPHPAWEKIPPAAVGSFENYALPGRDSGDRHPAVIMISSRGCPYRCAFCSSSFFGSHRVRSPKAVVDEMERWKADLGVEHFLFIDDSFNAKRGFVEAFCDEVTARRLEVSLWTSLRANLTSADQLARMRRAGFVSVAFGGESGSERVLKRIDKGLKPGQILEAVRMARAAGLFSRVSFIFSHPDETREEIEATFDLMARIEDVGGEDVYVGSAEMIVYPGTKVEARARAEGLLPEDFSWNSEGDSLILFERPELPLEEIRAMRSRFAHRDLGPLGWAGLLLGKAASARDMGTLKAGIGKLVRMVRR